jgi:hypothetical protein
MQDQLDAQLRASLLQCLPSIVYSRSTHLDTTECVHMCIRMLCLC